MVTHQQQNDLIVGPKTTLWILAICIFLCAIAGIMARRVHETNTSQQIEPMYPGVVDQGQIGRYSPTGPRAQMYELRENPPMSNTSPNGNTNGAPPTVR